MNVLLDTNILLRMADTLSPMSATAVGAVGTLVARGDVLFLAPQVLYEFWAAATRPNAVNGLGMSCAQAAAEMARVRALFTFSPDNEDVFLTWEQLVITHHVTGKSAHDARLVAAMMVHGISHILTFNTGDFTRYPGITVLDPTAAVGVP